MGIYDNVKAICKERDISVSGLEEELNFARGSIYKWNSNTPGVDKVLAVAKVLNVSMDELLRDC